MLLTKITNENIQIELGKKTEYNVMQSNKIWKYTRAE